jgi:hypothetical protein
MWLRKPQQVRAFSRKTRRNVGKVAADLATGTGDGKRDGKTSERLSGKFSDRARRV